ncbi:hypothetical protein F3J23_11900 [Chryseobacterium sp. Tr-659]|uniref:hypothetical protein n=1 Tax=Chryseobacterium sp. Tr-659 TaxID=2608340 RepID=UPI00142432BA|nr:hypothetical protein [Chryseobacterium sp. Tr-659]NIF06144.1 hypothetical protein [Chryseobacterium sp. Tr-659]
MTQPKYILNEESFTHLIHSKALPDDDEYSFDIDDTEITIKKPDDNGDSGGSILIIKDHIALYLSKVTEQGYEFFFPMYRENEEDSFQTITENSPEYILNFAKNIWSAIVDHVDTMENENGDVEKKSSFNTFKKQFGIYQVPHDLEKLFEFEQKHGAENYAESFCLYSFNKAGLKTYSEEPGFLNSFIEFATATGGGSTYAFWVISEDLEKCPIVVFGDEGGIHLTAKNIMQLIHLLTYDTEITVGWDNAYFFKDEEYAAESEEREAFWHWAKENFDFDPISTDEEADAIIKTARDKYVDSFYDFLVKYDIDTSEGYEDVKAHRKRSTFEQNFEIGKCPKELLLLYDFQERHINYAQYFYLQGYDKTILKQWNPHSSFISTIWPFARANSFGAIYALWDDGTGKELNEMPVIVLNEGNSPDIIAGNILQLLHLLTFDIEPVINDESFMLYNNKDSFAPSLHTEMYCSWLKNNFNLGAVEEPFEEIIDPAQEKYSDALWEWENNLKD